MPRPDSRSKDQRRTALTGHSDADLAAAYSQDQRQIVTASRDGTAVIWLSQAWTEAAGVTVRADGLPVTKHLAQ